MPLHELHQPLMYLDPGSGSIIIQLILATLLGLGVFLRTQWSKIKTLFKKKNEATDEDNENDESQ